MSRERRTTISVATSNPLFRSLKFLTSRKPKLTYAAGRNLHEDFSEDEVNSRYPNIPQDPQSYTNAEN
jgi:hypothetical protein